MALIAVNTRMLIKDKLDGTGWFAFETLKRIVTQHPEHRFIFFFDRKFNAEFIFSSNILPVVIYPQARHPWLWYTWFEISIHRALKKYRPDLFFSPESFICSKAAVPQVAVIHDLNFEHFPQYMPAQVARYYSKWSRIAAQNAKRIGTVSEFSRQDIVKTYNINIEKTDVLYNGIHDLYKPLSAAEQEQVRNQYTLGCRYIIYTGSLHQRKNTANMVRAFAQYKKKYGGELKFVLVSDRSKMEGDLQLALSEIGIEKDLIFTGRLSAKALAQLTASAEAMMYVSFFEGFGIPVIEAMRCGVPVITSSVSCLPEISGNAALCVDPHSVNAITGAMEQVLQHQEFAEQLKQKGKIRQQDFSWDKTASLTWQSLQLVLAEKGKE
ncbi:MAG TPA: glycosyltransferase family 1 protein [Bacteroidia bacterium]|nr:glycosyltransferase family 4 protein [Bacteroidia bacterium]MCW5918607.1 glycosyltransferase family 4 protein [Bacteroidota bacterium]MCC7513687.1 glycosyltransferase family 4 protein [Bacteroidia bacterium]HMU76362.1 glycosyltransferase family 1 protein [Bacteroidia bacterium]HMW10451.1 glycosyltransferase family 1 protein [Bacteroidia bacterium]